jgi:hypothetical protein
MTQMSDHRFARRPLAGANHAIGKGRSRMARALHGMTSCVLVRVPLMLVAGCFIPPSLSADTTDAGANSPPTITSVRAELVEFPEYSRLAFEQGDNAGTLSVTGYDTDLDDTLYVKVFVDYNIPDPTPARSSCTATGRTVQRTASCDMRGVCTTADVGRERVMQVYVFDRPVQDTGVPLYQAMLENSGGMSTSRTYFLLCREASL